MNPPPVPAPRRRQIWPWIVGLFLAPVVAVGAMVASVIHLNSDAARLRDQILAASGGGWHARVQLNVSRVIVGAVRSGLSFVPDLPDEARQALQAVRSASVGVYEQDADAATARAGDFWRQADENMLRHGWTRVVGVVDGRDTVLIYVPDGSARGKPSRICLAVCNDRNLVVVSAAIRPDVLVDLARGEIARHGRIRL